MKAIKIIIGTIAVIVVGYLVFQAYQNVRAAGFNNKAQVLLDENKFAEALPFLQQAVAIAPGNASIHRNFGVAYDELKQTGKAIASYERSLALKPNQPDVREKLDLLKGERETERQRLGKMEKDMEGTPGDAALTAQIGTTYENLGDVARAIEMYERSLNINANQPEIRQKLDALKKK